jgi:uncharacterized SAM-binding protein YcdF (DUF218 family)
MIFEVSQPKTYTEGLELAVRKLLWLLIVILFYLLLLSLIAIGLTFLGLLALLALPSAYPLAELF